MTKVAMTQEQWVERMLELFIRNYPQIAERVFWKLGIEVRL